MSDTDKTLVYTATGQRVNKRDVVTFRGENALVSQISPNLIVGGGVWDGVLPKDRAAAGLPPMEDPRVDRVFVTSIYGTDALTGDEASQIGCEWVQVV